MKQTETVLITGAATGIGKAIARRFAAEGYRVALACHTHVSEAQQLAADFTDAAVFCADLSGGEGCEALCREVREKMGAVHVLVNNAGVSLHKLIQDTTEEELDRLLSVDLKAPYLLSRAFCREMIARKAGAIINISSVWGQTGGSMETAYSAAKAGLVGLSRALAKELGPSGVRVNCVCPGVIDTAMRASFSGEDRQALSEETPLCRLGTPEEVAACVYFLASGEASFVTGQVLSPNGGFFIG